MPAQPVLSKPQPSPPISSYLYFTNREIEASRSGPLICLQDVHRRAWGRRGEVMGENTAGITGGCDAELRSFGFALQGATRSPHTEDTEQ